MQNPRIIRRIGSRLALAIPAVASVMLASGCNDAVSGGATGAGLGALAGLGLGSLTGDMGKGAAAGAIIGGVGGAIIGDQNQRSERRNEYRGTYHRGSGYPD